ncbi:hypothetical protein KIN20_012609 [Parelaphostrongylus tenuis]|uniref:Uncharacterized protein n=1 Tax=Parelaphostrongylus tenuis TaxID=148309 RepID=A0AAD5QKE4_PARTN|nr:hypothetical protein KIN20_012609 [Parelaphostrongylus tenuis]
MFSKEGLYIACQFILVNQQFAIKASLSGRDAADMQFWRSQDVDLSSVLGEYLCLMSYGVIHSAPAMRFELCPHRNQLNTNSGFVR